MKQVNPALRLPAGRCAQCLLKKIAMKTSFLILFSLLVISSLAQNIWKPISLPDTLNAKAINAEKEGIIFVATGGNNDFFGLFRSFDDGNSWDLIDADTLSSYVNIFTIRYNSENVLFIGANSRIYRSYDDGDNFETVFTGANNILKINFSPDNEIYAVGWSYIIRSSNGGNTWETLFEGGNIYFADVDFGLNGEIYTVGGSYDGPGTGSGFHRSLDHGVTWENIGITDLHVTSIEVKGDGEILVGGGEANILSSKDLGESWALVSDLLVTALESDSEDNLFVGVYGLDYEGFRFSYDWGNHWVNLNDTVLNPYIDQISISPDNTIYLQCKNLSSQPYQLFKSINPIVTTEEHFINSEIIIFPNPTKEKLSILTNRVVKIKHIVIYNLNGQKIIAGMPTENTIDVSKLNSGLYIVELELDNEIVRKKIIVE
jgi:photosystem II stability/assembly factor-like uncharacterized protein